MLRVMQMFSATKEAVGDVTRGTLHVATERAKHHPKVGCNGHTDSCIKLFFLPDKTKKGLRKTQAKRNFLNRVWEEEFTYEDVPLGELKTARGLEGTVVNHNILFKDDVLECLWLGPSADVPLKPFKCLDSSSEEVSHWEAMLMEPWKWVENRHSLRPPTNFAYFSSLGKGKQKVLHDSPSPSHFTKQEDPGDGSKFKKSIHVPQLEFPSEHTLPTLYHDSSIGNAYAGSYSLFIQSYELEHQHSINSFENSSSLEKIENTHNSSIKRVTWCV